MTRAAIVGLGQAAALSLEALRGHPGLEIVWGVDPRGPDAPTVLRAGTPVYRSLADVPAHELDLVVVATPTDTHVELCRELLSGPKPSRRILCEKPVGADAAEVSSLFALAQDRGVQLQCLYHYAFSPEVLWAWRHWAAIREEHGEVVSFESAFLDPKPDLRRAVHVLTSSWADSGINALSVVARFLELESAVGEEGGSPTAHRTCVRFRCSATRGAGTIATTWKAADVVKTTRLTLADGTVLTLRHTDQQAVLEGPRERSAHGPRESSSPATVRYRAMFSAYLSGDASVFDQTLSLHLHALLAQSSAR